MTRLGYSMNGTSGLLRPAVEAYLGGEMTSTELMALQAYLKRSTTAPKWGGEGAEGLRECVEDLDTREQLEEWVGDAFELGIDPSPLIALIALMPCATSRARRGLSWRSWSRRHRPRANAVPVRWKRTGATMKGIDRKPTTEVEAALSYLEKTLAAAIADRKLKKGLDWTAAIEADPPWLALLSVKPVGKPTQ